MKTLYFNERIEASPNKVHNVMLSLKTYEEWTKPFSPTSSFNGNWSEGSNVLFTSTDENNVVMGMIATVDKNIPGEIVIVRHIGIFADNKEIFEGEQVDRWKNSLEVYRFKGGANHTDLLCSMEVDSKENEEMFEKMWPEALTILKEICERE